MRNILTISTVFVLLVMLIGCGDSTTGDSAIQTNADNVTSGEAAEETNRNSSNQPQNDFLGSLVDGSDLIVHGTLEDMTTKMSEEDIPYIFATYKIHEVVSGDYEGGDTITVKFVGGEYPNGNRLTATNSPNIQLGQESVFMIQKHKDTGCEFVRCMEGYFTIENGQVIAANESAIVVDKRGAVEYVSLAARTLGQYKSNLKNMNVGKFLAHLKNLDAKSAKQRKGGRVPVADNDLYAPFNAYKGLTQAGRAPAPSKAVSKRVAQNKGSNFDLWEEQALRENGGNPVLGQYYSGE